MGQTLSSPATSKRSEEGQDARFAYAVSEMQGWRITMEDAHATLLQLDEDKPKEESNTFFAVYDGHGGGSVAKYAGQHVHKRLLTEEAYTKKDYNEALKQAFLGTDKDLLADPAHARDPSGATAVAALVTHDGKIYVANAGDSRSVMSVKGQVKELSFDHKPSGEVERARISAAGGYIEYGRVNGNLALSRAIGDFEFKKNPTISAEKQIITADPDVTCHEITDEDEFIIIACDGIWDCLTSQQVIDFVRYRVSEGMPLTKIGEAMCDHCLAPDTSSGAGIGCDNMTIMIIAILHGRTKEEWYAWITDRVKHGYGYQTPSTVPQLYAPSRLMSFRARQEALETRNRSRDNNNNQDDDDGSGGILGNSGLGGFAKVLGGSTGGISFHPGSGIMSGTGGLMFGGDDSDEDSDEDTETGGGTGFFRDSLGEGGEATDPTQNLKAQLEEYEKEEEKDSAKSSTEAPQFNGDVPSSTAAVVAPVEQQHKSEPLGDAPTPVVQAEGLMDKSEDPLKQ